VSSSGEMHADDNSFKLLYPFPDMEEAEEHAHMLRAVGMRVAFCDERGNLLNLKERGC
jgi:hypothetical protein